MNSGGLPVRSSGVPWKFAASADSFHGHPTGRVVGSRSKIQNHQISELPRGVRGGASGTAAANSMSNRKSPLAVFVSWPRVKSWNAGTFLKMVSPTGSETAPTITLDAASAVDEPTSNPAPTAESAMHPASAHRVIDR